MIIDSHQHYWTLDRGDYGWLTPDVGAILYQDYMPEHLKQELQRCNVKGTVLVQAAPTMEETEFMLELCAQEDSVLGVVGWLDVGGVEFEKHYVRFRTNPRFVGIRPSLPSVSDGDWSRYPELLRNLELLAEDGFPIDLLLRTSDLLPIKKLLDRVPKLTAVIDHLANPIFHDGRIEQWANGMERVSQFEHTSCKLSGMATGAGRLNVKVHDVALYVQTVIDKFGTDRLMFGSDWPVCLQAGSFTEMLEMVRAALPASLTRAQIDAILGGNAARIYRLPSL